MFRKITHIILSLFLMVVTTEVTLSMHYCSGELVSTSINKESKSCCDGAGGCCENRTLRLEIDDDYVTPLQLQVFEPFEIVTLFTILVNLNLESADDESKAVYDLSDSPPPPLTNTRLALLQAYLC